MCIRDRIKAVEKRKEPTVVVFYGDHLPTMGLKAEDLKSRYLYNTNYVIWDNIGLKKQDRNIPSYQIMSEVFERLGIHSGTLFNYHQTRRKTKNYLSDLELLQYDIPVSYTHLVSCFVMAKNMGHEGVLSSSVVMLTTLFSAFTLTGWLYILKSMNFI